MKIKPTPHTTEPSPRPGLHYQTKVEFRRAGKGRKTLVFPQPTPVDPMPDGALPRITRLMALALHFERLIQSGEIRDQAELARLGGVTEARASQIMGLTLLAPAIQEELLFLPRTVRGRDLLNERHLRQIFEIVSWEAQMELWETLKPRRNRLGNSKSLASALLE